MKNNTLIIWSLLQVHDFCVAFRCVQGSDESHAWKPYARACICFSNKLWNQAQSQLKKYDSLFNSSESLDCNSSDTLNGSCVEDLELDNLKRSIYNYVCIRMQERS